MKTKTIIASLILFLGSLLFFGYLYQYAANSAVMDPKGLIGDEQRDLIVISLQLMSIIVIPVFLLTIFICVKFREGNKEAKYTPDWDHSIIAEVFWWGLPCIIIFILSVITWKSTHELDPYRTIPSKEKPLRVQVVALQWKWLFIYPEEKIATVNYFKFPVNRVVSFEIAADAPMNSFWIPELGGQIYAMPGMITRLSLIADETGNFMGSSANISGEGFAYMTFTASAVNEKEFEEWIAVSQQDEDQLNEESYKKLVLPGILKEPLTYKLEDLGLYSDIVMKYMMPEHVQKKGEAKVDE